MKVIVFGATGMVGQGVLRECLLDPEVLGVLAVGRSPSGVTHPKLRELVHADFGDFSAVRQQLSGYDACFFCLGVSSAGMNEADYSRVTYDFTVAAARTLSELNPGSKFIYVSGSGTDSSEKGRILWARVKGRTENALLALPLDAYMFRAGIIQPLHGIVSKTRLYRVGYALLSPFYPVLRAIFPKQLTTTENVGLAMLEVARHGAASRWLENAQIEELAAKSGRATRSDRRA